MIGITMIRIATTIKGITMIKSTMTETRIGKRHDPH
jgi:hypothetical protein